MYGLGRLVPILQCRCDKSRMHKPETWKLVLSYLSPNRPEVTSSDWRHLVGRSLVPEVKQETIRFYGTSDEPESTFPGLDYANPNHRLRLSSYPSHSQLFKAFDALRLTYDEIYLLCKWHGTKKMKDEYERRHGVQIVDTTLDDVHPYSRLKITVTHHEGSELNMAEAGDATIHTYDEDEVMEEDATREDVASMEDHADASDVESEDDVQRSVGLELNQRLLANAEANVQARARGETVSMDLDWEQWVKEAAEREAIQGSSAGIINILASLAGRPGSSASDFALPLPQAGTVQGNSVSATVEGLVSADAGEPPLSVAASATGGI